jgi:Zn-dependent protease
MAGLAAAFALAVGLRWLAQWSVARLLRLPRAHGAARLDPLGTVAAVLSGTGWGRPVARPAGGGTFWALLAGPAAVLLASQAVFAGYAAAYPHLGLPLRLNRPSDVLHGAVAPTPAAQLMLSVGVGLLCFGLLALLPVPPFDGYRLLPVTATAHGGVVERVVVIGVLVLLVVPVAGRPPLLAALDAVAGPVVRAWA